MAFDSVGQLGERWIQPGSRIDLGSENRGLESEAAKMARELKRSLDAAAPGGRPCLGQEEQSLHALFPDQDAEGGV
jgi:hypothetical protein